MYCSSSPTIYTFAHSPSLSFSLYLFSLYSLLFSTCQLFMALEYVLGQWWYGTLDFWVATIGGMAVASDDGYSPRQLVCYMTFNCTFFSLSVCRSLYLSPLHSLSCIPLSLSLYIFIYASLHVCVYPSLSLPLSLSLSLAHTQTIRPQQSSPSPSVSCTPSVYTLTRSMMLQWPLGSFISITLFCWEFKLTLWSGFRSLSCSTKS